MWFPIRFPSSRAKALLEVLNTRLLAVFSFMAVASFAQTGFAQEVSPSEILKYFPGKWEWSRSDGESGTVEWKLVSDGKALAGPGMSTFGGADFGLGGWEAQSKKWAHTWYTAKGGYGRLEWNTFEGGTYRGVVRTFEPGGELAEAKTSCKIVDQNTFILTIEPDARETWKRLK